MEKLKKVLKKISKFFGWIIAGAVLVGLFVMKVMSSNRSEVDQLIDTKKEEINLKKEELKNLSNKVEEKKEVLDKKIEDSKELNSQISSDKKDRDTQAEKFLGE